MECSNVVLSVHSFKLTQIVINWQLQKASRPPPDRTMVVACLAEVAQHMGAPIAGYIDVVSQESMTSCLIAPCICVVTTYIYIYIYI